MGRSDLEILKTSEKEPWFLGNDRLEKYPISYRYVLCFSLRRFFRKEGWDPIEGYNELEKLKNAIKTKGYYRRNNFMELLPLDTGGFTVVDQADGIFPLVLYPDTRDDKDKKERVSAFKNSVQEVIDKYKEIYSFLGKHSTDEWNQQLQEQLFEEVGFKYPVT